MKKRTKKFRKFKNSRYLIGSVPKDVWASDLIEYNKHRYKVFTAETKVDDKPLKLNPYDYIDQRKLSTDAARLRQIDKDNKDLLRAINIINRTTGKVDTYNPIAYTYNSKWKAHVTKMKEIEAHNKDIYKKLISVKSDYNKSDMHQFWKKIVEEMRATAKFPLTILKKVSLDQILAAQLSISCGLEKVAERPLCFMEFQVKNGVVLGRIVIELYYDHVPVTVQNFLTICCQKNDNITYKNCAIHRIIPGQYCVTGDITKGNGKGGNSIYGKYFAEENHVLRHTKAGILSMVRVGNQENNSQFCITFAKMEKLDHSNVVFGRIVKGSSNLMKIQGYGRKIGKPLAEIVISNCGKI